MAKKCCSCCSSGDYDDPLQPDECMCGCGYFNGAYPIITSQLLLLIGTLFSLAALGDCAFVEINTPIGAKLGTGEVTIRRLGMFTFEMEDGQCYFWNDNYISLEQQVEFYIDNVLGPDWVNSINLAVTAFGCGVLFWFYMTTYCCSSQIRPIRNATGFMIAVVIMVLQGLSFLVYNTQWCADNGCSFARSSGFSIGAMLSFLFSGLAFCGTTNYPGNEELDMARAAAERAQKDMMAANETAALEQGAPYDPDLNQPPEGQQPWQSY